MPKSCTWCEVAVLLQHDDNDSETSAVEGVFFLYLQLCRLYHRVLHIFAAGDGNALRLPLSFQQHLMAPWWILSHLYLCVWKEQKHAVPPVKAFSLALNQHLNFAVLIFVWRVPQKKKKLYQYLPRPVTQADNDLMFLINLWRCLLSSWLKFLIYQSKM